MTLARVVTILAILGAVAFGAWKMQGWRAAAAVETAARQTAARQARIESVGFYRMRSAYTVKDTGERIDVDYVAACATVMTMYRDGDRSVDTPFGVAPKMMFAVTRDGHAIQLVTPRACHGEVEEGFIPPDLIPLTIWHDDVNDLHFGWGYTSQDAYDNARSRMDFEGATLTAATYADFMAWRAKAEAEFKPVGQVRSPWGYSDENDSGLNVSTGCHFYIRTPVFPAGRPALTTEWEKRGKPEFWIYVDGMREPEFWDDVREQLILSPDVYPRTKGGGIGGIQNYSEQVSSRVRYHEERGFPSNEVYPYLPISLASNPPPTLASRVFPTKVLVSDDWKGLAACGENDPKIDHVIEGKLFNAVLLYDRYEGEPVGDRTRPFLANDTMVIPQIKVDPPRLFFQRDEFVLTKGPTNLEGIMR